MVNNNMKKEIIRFHSKISRILSFFMLLLIPALIITLIYNFNVFAMFGIITISIFTILIVCWINSRGVIIEENKIIFLEFSKKEFLIKDIESLNIGKIGDIVIIYNGKEFHKGDMIYTGDTTFYYIILKDDTEIKFGLFRLGKKNEKEIYKLLIEYIN